MSKDFPKNCRKKSNEFTKNATLQEEFPKELTQKLLKEFPKDNSYRYAQFKIYSIRRIVEEIGGVIITRIPKHLSKGLRLPRNLKKIPRNF